MAQVYFLAFLSPPAEGDTRARVTLVLRYAAAESLPAPLYDVAVDVDVHPHLAAPAKVCAAALLRILSSSLGASGALSSCLDPVCSSLRRRFCSA